MWFLVALVGYLLLAITFVLDKRVLSKEVPNSVVYTFYSTVFLLLTLLLYPFGATLLSTPTDWLWAISSGVSFGLALWTIFIALMKGEASHINPFNGAIITIATYGIASVLLGETLTQVQLVGVGILVVATLLLSFEITKEGRVFHMGYLWAAISGVLFGFSHVAAKIIYESYPFITGLVWTRASIGLVGLALLLSPAVWKSFRPQKKRKKGQAKNTILLVGTAKTLGIASALVLQYAMFLGSVTLVNALSGMQYVFMFIIIFTLTKIAPKLFSEFFTKQELVVQIVALVLVSIGSALFVI